ncbi:uncharacterized protein LOC130499532 [Raphanus sativus]|uniref:Uncharacterized protein LOC130499532 n=1 Tax=Raphanus sativus TaxID=3726 RepID=A0A9W3CDR9_RAPSA|nr:uncharacterized protein LOC130499532 [Raphanus sativus]XP_056849656.1 uncharacterized protein LOC130499532 [Raphanus sativus]
MTTAFVPLFDGSHYECWSLKMKTFLKTMDLWDVVETGTQQEPLRESSWSSNEFNGEYYTSSADGYYSAYWKQYMEAKDVNALYLIQTALSHEILPWIAFATSSKEAWEILLVKSLGGPIFQARKLSDLKKEYMDIKMMDSETIHEFTGKLMELVFRMKSCGWKVEDKELVKKIISSLPSKFDKVLVDIAETLSISVLIDCLLVHEYNIMRQVQEYSLEESVAESVDVEESFQEEAEILYSLNEITQCQVISMERQGEVSSVVQQNQKMLMQLQKQMVALMQHTL